MTNSDSPSQKPRFPIRRFDVFAEFHRIQNQERGMKSAQAKGRAIWAAKVVAGRGGRGGPAPKPASDEKNVTTHRPEQHDEQDDEFRSVGGEVQTDATFDREIVNRMGQEFYHDVFRPAIEAAYAEGKHYEDIRDAIRKTWK